MELEKEIYSLNFENIHSEEYLNYLKLKIEDIDKNLYKKNDSTQAFKDIFSLFFGMPLFIILFLGVILFIFNGFIFFKSYLFYILNFIDPFILNIDKVKMDFLSSMKGGMIGLGLIIFAKLGFIFFLEEDEHTKKGFLYNIKNKCKFYFFKKNVEHNILLNTKMELLNKFINIFDKKMINKIHSFYKNNNYEFGTPEHFRLTSNFKEIQELYQAKNYLKIFELYSLDKKLYEEAVFNSLDLTDKL